MSRNVRPVGAGNTAVGASVGGPIFSNLGPPMPVPLVAVYGRHGLDAKTDVDVGLHLPVARAFGIDAGAARLLRDQDGAIPAFMAGGRVYLFANSLPLVRRQDPTTNQPYGFEPRFYEELYGTCSWQVQPTILGWAGLSAFAQIEKAAMHPTVYAGAAWQASPTWSFGVEAKWMAFLTNQRNLVIDYRGINSRGALALQLGAAYTFKGAEQ